MGKRVTTAKTNKATPGAVSALPSINHETSETGVAITIPFDHPHRTHVTMALVASLSHYGHQEDADEIEKTLAWNGSVDGMRQAIVDSGNKYAGNVVTVADSAPQVDPEPGDMSAPAAKAVREATDEETASMLSEAPAGTQEPE